MSTFKQDRQDAAMAAQKEANTATYKAWVVKHSEFFDCEANRQMLFGPYGYMDFTDSLSEANLDFAYGNLKTHLALRKIKTPEVIKAELIEEIISLLSAHSRRDEFMLKSEETRMRHMSLDALQARLAELKAKIGMASQPVSTLKAFVADARRDDRPFPGFPTLDRSVQAAEIKAMESSALKRLVRLYSAAQVNARLAGRS
jgi:hypothetical protein